jgi:hypothetical protein
VFAVVPTRIPRLAAALAAAGVAAAAVGILTLRGATLPNVITVHWATFYVITAGGYAALPFVRRGDVLMVASWLVLAAGVAPCIAGQEISPPHMFADMAGVMTAAVPIYIARLRQVTQGDTRNPRRRQTERENLDLETPDFETSDYEVSR